MASGVGTTHHVKLDGNFYMVVPGSYRKMPAPTFGARFSTGDPDLNNLSMWQHWGQRNWIGGMDAEDWMDDAMYDEGVGVNTTRARRMTLSRDLKKGSSGYSVGSTTTKKKFFVYNKTLYLVNYVTSSSSVLYRYIASTDTWTTHHTFTDMRVRSVATFDGKVFIGGVKSSDGSPRLLWSTTLTSYTDVTNPAGVSHGIQSMRSFQQRLYVAYGTKVWRLKLDRTWDGNVVFYDAQMNSDSNYILAMEPHLGFLYMLSENGHIHRTDGNSTFDLWSWDGGTSGVALKSFDGRLFVATFEYTDSAVSAEGGYGVLYQMSGSAMTQLKRWGEQGEASSFGSLIAHDRRLFYGASNLFGISRGFGVAAYDPVEDAHSIWATNLDTTTYAAGSAPYTNLIVDDVFYFGHKLWVSIRAHGVFHVRYSWKDERRLDADYDTTAAGVQVGPQNGGWFTTSTYDAGIVGVQKLWRKIAIDYEIPAVGSSIVCEYSTDNGASYTTALTINPLVGPQSRTTAVVYLNNIRSASIKLRFTLRSTDSTKTPVLFGYVVSYLLIPEPNWMWSMTLAIPESQKLLDGTTETVDSEAILLSLASAYRNKQLVNFIDADGLEYAGSGTRGVFIHDIAVMMPVLDQPLKGQVQVTLIESAETY